MPSPARLCALLVSFLAISGVARAERAAPPLVNWSAPATYSPSGGSKIRALTDISSPVPFITTAPCRQYNSLLATPLAQGVNRAVPLTGAPCNIPASAVAVSVNITVFNITGATGNGVFKVDTVTPPAVAWINYPPSEAQRGNAGVVALNGSGQIIVQVAQGAGQVDFIVDTNGYYASAAANQGNSFKVINSGGSTIPAIWGETTSTNVNATGVYGLASSTTGITDGVWGRNFSSSDFSAGVLGISEGTSGLTFGVYGRSNSTSDGAVGTYGEALGSTGRSYGVEGIATSNSSGAAGVYGVAGSDPGPGIAALTRMGVRGASTTGYGVVGISSVSIGVRGTNLITEGYLGYDSTYGVFALGNIGATGTKPFIDPHPTDPKKVIAYVALEGPEAGTYCRGRGRIHNGVGVISVPNSFRLVSDEEGLTVQITPIGQAANVAVLSADLNTVVVQSSVKDLEFYYIVNGVRRNFKNWNPIVENSFYVPEGPNARMPGAFSAEQRRALIANGTYNEDGTVNLQTAERVGWAKVWADRETQAAGPEAQKAAGTKQR